MMAANQLTVIERFLLAVLFRVSITRTVKLDLPEVVGVPEITPLVLFRASPAGSLPLLMLQVYGLTPPLAATVAE